MHRTVRRAPILLALLLVLPLAMAGAPTGPAAPRDGDAALYLVRTTDGDDVREARVLLSWHAERVLVPGGEGRLFPTLSASVAAPGEAAGGDARLADALLLNPGKDYATRDPETVLLRAAHVDAPGGAVLARTTAWHEREPLPGGERGQWMHRSSRADACDLASPELLLAALAGLDARAADAKLAACGAGAERDGATLSVAFPDGARLALVAAPGLAFPASWTLDAAGAREEATLLGWREGDAALPRARPLDAPLRVGLVEWSALGPATGDLADHPFRDAQRALETQRAEARAFFAESPQARVLTATHAWTDPATLAASSTDAWRARIKGVPCGAAPAAPGEGAGVWSVGWAAPEGSLFAVVERVDAAGALALDRPVASSRDDYSWAESGVPATLAPAPRDLARHLHALDAYALRGTYSLDYVFTPSAQGNAASAAAAVSRGACERDPATGALAYVGLSLWFVDGEARSIVGSTIEKGGDASLAALVGPLAPPPAGPAEAGGLPPLALAGGAAALAAGVAATVLLPRALQPLYSRIHRGSALDSEKRARLLEAIHRRPGAPLRQLAADLGLPVNTAEHHARVLLRLQYVRRARTAEGVAYYPSEHPRAPVAHVLDRAHADAVLDAALARDGATQQEIAALAGVRESHLSALLRDLESAGLVERRRDGRVVRVHATAKAAALRAHA